MITFRQLQAIQALRNTGSFGEAAAQIGLTQPALSMQIANLEEQLEVTLFDRSQHPIQPTAIGEQFIEQSAQVLAGRNQLIELTRSYTDQLHGSITIGVIPTIAPYVLPKFIHEVKRSYSQLNLVIHEMKTEEIVRDVIDQKINMGLLATPLGQSHLKETPVFYERMLCYLGKDLTKKYPSNRMTIRNIRKEKMWHLTEGNCFREQSLRLCGYPALPYIEDDVQYQSGSVDALISIVDELGGLTILPELAALKLSKRRQDRLRFIERNEPVREVSWVTSRYFGRKAILEGMKDALFQSLPTPVQSNQGSNIVDIYDEPNA